jgi:hypothetical protein
MLKNRKRVQVRTIKDSRMPYFIVLRRYTVARFAERHGIYTTVYNRLNRWSQRGIWKWTLDAGRRNHAIV